MKKLKTLNFDLVASTLKLLFVAGHLFFLSVALTSSALGQQSAFELDAILQDPESRVFMDSGVDLAECLGFLVQIEPGAIEGLEQVRPATGLGLNNNFFYSLVGEGRRYELVFEYGDFYQSEDFEVFIVFVFLLNMGLDIAISDGVRSGRVSQEHLRLFRDRRDRIFSASLGYALAGPHTEIDRKIRQCHAHWGIQ